MGDLVGNHQRELKMVTFLGVLPIAAAATSLLFGDKPWIRWACVVIILIDFWIILGMLIAPHRLAEDLLAGPPGQEWLMGARATRDIVHRAIPVVVSAILSMTVLALLPLRTGARKK